MSYHGETVEKNLDLWVCERERELVNSMVKIGKEEETYNVVEDKIEE